MRVEGTKALSAPVDVVWQLLNDPSQMARLMPGVESFEIADDDHWSAKVKVPLGMGGLKLSFDFTRSEAREPEFAKLNAKGKGVGAIVSLDTEFTLTPNGSATSMAWGADVGILGPVGSMGQRVLGPIVNQQVGNVLNALEKLCVEAAG